MLKGDLKKQAILDTAENLFFEKGYTNTTIDDILTTLKCSKGSLYHHFESKQQILGELGRQQAEAAFKAYQDTPCENTLERFNTLLYYALPVRKGQERLVATSLPLIKTADHSVLMDAMMQAQEKLFVPEMQTLLDKMIEEGTAFCDQEFLPVLIWDTYTAFYRRLLYFGHDVLTGEKQPGDIMPVLISARFVWERVMDIPYGTLEIIRVDEVLACIHQAINHNKYLTAKR